MGGTHVKIFVGDKQPLVCGYQVTKGSSVIVRVPADEAYSNQKQYESVIASCPYAPCLQNGVPAFARIVTAKTLNAMGNVVSNPSGITLLAQGQLVRHSSNN